MYQEIATNRVSSLSQDCAPVAESHLHCMDGAVASILVSSLSRSLIADVETMQTLYVGALHFRLSQSFARCTNLIRWT